MPRRYTRPSAARARRKVPKSENTIFNGDTALNSLYNLSSYSLIVIALSRAVNTGSIGLYRQRSERVSADRFDKPC